MPPPLPPIVVGAIVAGGIVLGSRVAHAKRLSNRPRLVPLPATTRLDELPYGDRRFIVYTEQAHPFIAKSVADARLNGPLVHCLSSSDTGPQGVNLPPGHPIPGVLYVAHPCSGAYYPAADFHRAVFEQKLSELLNLLSSLGATQIHAEAQYGWSRDFAAKLTLPKYLRLATKGDRKGAGEAVFSATWPDRRQHPEIPTGMHWFDSEPIWKAQADLVLHHDGSEPLDLQWTLEYESNFALSADAESNFKELQIGFGGEFNEFDKTRWQVHAEFPKRLRHLRWLREWRGRLERFRPRRNIPTLPNPPEGRPHG